MTIGIAGDTLGPDPLSISNIYIYGQTGAIGETGNSCKKNQHI